MRRLHEAYTLLMLLVSCHASYSNHQCDRGGRTALISCSDGLAQHWLLKPSSLLHLLILERSLACSTLLKAIFELWGLNPEAEAGPQAGSEKPLNRGRRILYVMTE